MKTKLFGLILVLVVLLVGYYILVNSKDDEAIPVTPVVQITTPTITFEDITKENYTGKKPIITGTGLLVETAQSIVTKDLLEFETQANTEVPNLRKEFGTESPTANYSLEINARYVEGPKTQSIVIDEYRYTGGANGSSSYKVVTVSKKSGEIVTINDIVIQEKQSAFLSFVKKELKAWRPEVRSV